MFEYAQIDNAGNVVSVSRFTTAVVNPSLISLEGHEADVHGKRWDGAAFVALAPVTTVQPISRLEFMDRFTDEELAAVLAAAKAVAAVEVFVKKMDAASQINLADPRTMAGVQALEAQQLIEVGRADEILTAVDNGRAVNEY